MGVGEGGSVYLLTAMFGSDFDLILLHSKRPKYTIMAFLSANG